MATYHLDVQLLSLYGSPDFPKRTNFRRKKTYLDNPLPYFWELFCKTLAKLWRLWASISRKICKQISMSPSLTMMLITATHHLESPESDLVSALLNQCALSLRPTWTLESGLWMLSQSSCCLHLSSLVVDPAFSSKLRFSVWPDLGCCHYHHPSLNTLLSFEALWLLPQTWKMSKVLTQRKQWNLFLPLH